MEPPDEEMPLPPYPGSKPTTLETWFYTFANTVLDSSTVRFQIGMFDSNDVISLSVRQLNGVNKKRREYAYYNILKEPDEKKTSSEDVEEMKKMVISLREKIRKLGQSDRYKTTSFANAKSVILVFDDRQTVELGK